MNSNINFNLTNSFRFANNSIKVIFCSYSSQNKKCHYKILGLTPTATSAEIKEAYYKYSKKFHPDINKDSSVEFFQEINSAYEILSNENLRANYDLAQGYTTKAMSMNYNQPKSDFPKVQHPKHKIYSKNIQLRLKYNQYNEQMSSKHSTLKYNNFQEKTMKETDFISDFNKEWRNKFGDINEEDKKEDKTDENTSFYVNLVLITLLIVIAISMLEKQITSNESDNVSTNRIRNHPR